jgi:hypothetical protein
MDSKVQAILDEYHARMTRELARGALFLQLEANAQGIARDHRLTIFGRRAIMPRAGSRQLECTFIESRVPTALQGGWLGGESAFCIDADSYGGNSLFSQMNRKRRIKVCRVWKSCARSSN